MGELRLVVLHYHLLPGGVTSVIREGLVALALHGGWSHVRATILVGRSDGVQAFIEQTERSAKGRLTVEVESWPILDYRSEPWPSQDEFETDAKRIVQHLARVSRAVRADAVWAHNPTLGKNPAVTEALARLADEAPGLRILSHIHDFAECARYDNLKRLRSSYGPGGVTLPFPASPLFTVLTLTNADRERLISAGYPPSGVYALSDPVPPPRSIDPFTTSERVRTGRRIDAWGRGNGYHLEPGGNWFIAPLRTIRRKNTLELALLLSLLDGDWRLLITLDCNSEPERPYAEAVKECLRRERLPAVLGFGAHLFDDALPYDRLVASADLVGTTAVLEGFGLTFVESGLRGRPLLGRDLPEATGDLAGLQRDGLYDSLLVPLSARERRETLELYRRKLAHIAEDVRLSPEAKNRAASEFEAIFEDEAVDFSYLDLPAQARVIHSLRDPARVDEILSANRGVAAVLSRGVTLPSQDDTALLMESVAPEKFARSFRAILDSPPGSAVDTSAVSQNLVEHFFQPQFLRLLFDAGDEWRLWPRQLQSKTGSRPSRADAEPATMTLRTNEERLAGIRVVLWDVYGTLLSLAAGTVRPQGDLEAQQAAFLDCLAAAGVDVSRPTGNAARAFFALIDEIHAAGRARGLHQPEVLIEDVWGALVERIFLDQWMTGDQARYAAARYELTVRPTHVIAGAPQAIVDLHELGVAQGIVSNAQFYTAPILMNELGEEVWSLLDPVLLFWSYEYGVAKPDPALFTRVQTVLTARGIRPDEVLMVGDDPENDATPACAIGWRTIVFVDDQAPGRRPKAEETGQKDAAPDAICRSLAALAPWLDALSRRHRGGSGHRRSVPEASQAGEPHPTTMAE